MRAYEALVIFRSAGTEQDLAQAAAKMEGTLKKLGGTVTHSQALGRRRLAYRIARQHEGQYHVFRFEAPTERIVELERLWRLEEAVVRFIILCADEVGQLTEARRPSRGAAARPTEAAPAATRS